MSTSMPIHTHANAPIHMPMQQCTTSTVQMVQMLMPRVQLSPLTAAGKKEQVKPSFL